MPNKRRSPNKRKDTGKKKKATKVFKRLVAAIVLIVVGVGVPKLLSLSPTLVENVYTQRLYPAIRQVVGYLPTYTEVSFTEVSAWILAATVIAIIAAFVLKLISGSLTLKGTISFWTSLLLIAGIVLNLFNITGGLNYHNIPLRNKLGLHIKERTNDQLYGYCTYLRGEAIKLRREVSVNDKGIFCVTDVRDTLLRTAHDVECIESINPWQVSVPSAKQLILPQVMTAFGLSGICMPFYAEASVNTAQPSLLIYSSAAHENAHYLGISGEDEANFAAYLACTGSKDVNIRYSGVMLALIESAGRLYELDKGLYTELLNGMSNEVRADLEDYSRYWNGKSDTVAGKLSSGLNDAYLKYNGKSSGERSYGEMVDLLLAYYAKCNGGE